MNTANLDEIKKVAVDVQFLIVKGGGMATKSVVEDYLMPRFGIDRCLAHEVMNDLERENVRPFVASDGDVYWNQFQMMRSEPKASDYSDLVFDVLRRR
jgi:hypothetical protein